MGFVARKLRVLGYENLKHGDPPSFFAQGLAILLEYFSELPQSVQTRCLAISPGARDLTITVSLNLI